MDGQVKRSDGSDQSFPGGEPGAPRARETSPLLQTALEVTSKGGARQLAAAGDAAAAAGRGREGSACTYSEESKHVSVWAREFGTKTSSEIATKTQNARTGCVYGEVGGDPHHRTPFLCTPFHAQRHYRGRKTTILVTYQHCGGDMHIPRSPCTSALRTTASNTLHLPRRRPAAPLTPAAGASTPAPMPAARSAATTRAKAQVSSPPGPALVLRTT